MGDDRVILFDIDRTLVHTYPHRVRMYDGPHYFEITLAAGATYCVHVRPYAVRLLAYLLDQGSWIRFGFWTAATRDYAEAIVSRLLTLAGAKEPWQSCVATLLTRDDAILLPSGAYVKHLSRAARILGTDQVMLLDDDPVHSRPKYNQSRVVPVPPFLAWQSDWYLRFVLRDLRQLRKRLQVDAVAEDASPTGGTAEVDTGAGN